MKQFPFLAVALAISAVAAEPAWDWGDSKDEWASSGEFEKSKALCRKFRDREPPASDRPDAAAARSLKGCDSEALYYGIGIEVLERLRSGRALPTPAARLAAEDALLNAAYRERLQAAAAESHAGAVTKEGIRAAERAWLRYRDAFLAFAAVQYPRVPRDELAAWLTRKRTALLTAEE
jgi:hypothetical protein